MKIILEIASIMRQRTLQHLTTEEERNGILKRALRNIKEKVSEKKTRLLVLATPAVLSIGGIAYSVSTHKPVLLGAAATAISAISYAPQAIKTVRTQSAGDISLLSETISIGAGIIWVAYGLQIGSPPIYIADGASTAYCTAVAFVRAKEMILKENNIRSVIGSTAVPIIMAGGGIASSYALHNPNVIGSEGGVAIFVMRFPQTLKSIRTRSTGDLSGGSISLSVSSLSAWSAYGGLIGSGPLLASSLANLAQTVAIGAVKVNEHFNKTKQEQTQLSVSVSSNVD